MKKKEVVGIVRIRGGYLSGLSDEFKDNKEVVLVAVGNDGLALKFASDRLKGEKEIVMAAIMNNCGAIKYASDALKANKEVTLAAVRDFGLSLEYVNDELRADKEVVLAAVKKNGFLIAYASDELRVDRDVVLAAVKQNGFILKNVATHFRNDLDVVMAAVKQEDCYGMIEYAGDEIRKNKEVALSILPNCAWVYYFFSADVQKEADVINLVNELLKKDGESVEDYLCDELKELKKKYNAKTLDIALEMDEAEIESKKLINGLGIYGDVKIAKNRL